MDGYHIHVVIPGLNTKVSDDSSLKFPHCNGNSIPTEEQLILLYMYIVHGGPQNATTELAWHSKAVTPVKIKG
jgi:hypothetical protein